MHRFAIVIVAACSLVGFDVSVDVPELTMPGNATAHAASVSYSGDTAPFQLDVDLSKAQEKDGVPDEVSTVTIKSLAFTITKGSGCFDFVDTVTITLESTKPNTVLQPVVVATGTSPGCAQTFALSPTIVDIKPYLDEGASIVAGGAGIPPENDVTFNGVVVLHASI